MIKLWIDTGKKHTYMTTSLAEKQFHYDNNPKKGSGKEYNGIFVFLILVIQIKEPRKGDMNGMLLHLNGVLRGMTGIRSYFVFCTK
jgi:hypothetical protein